MYKIDAVFLMLLKEIKSYFKKDHINKYSVLVIEAGVRKNRTFFSGCLVLLLISRLIIMLFHTNVNVSQLAKEANRDKLILHKQVESMPLKAPSQV